MSLLIKFVRIILILTRNVICDHCVVCIFAWAQVVPFENILKSRNVHLTVYAVWPMRLR